MHRNALAIQMASGAARLRHPIPVGLIVDHEKGIDPDDGIDLVAVLIVRGMFEADPVDAAVVIIPSRTHAYALGLAEFGVFGMAGNLVALDDDNSLDRGLLGLVAGFYRGVFLLNVGAPRDRQRDNDQHQAFHEQIPLRKRGIRTVPAENNPPTVPRSRQSGNRIGIQIQVERASP
jgi:hypothetical protein